MHERPLRARPFLDVVPAGGGGGEGVLGRVDSEGTDGFVVVSEGGHRFTGGEVPEATK